MAIAGDGLHAAADFGPTPGVPRLVFILFVFVLIATALYLLARVPARRKTRTFWAGAAATSAIAMVALGGWGYYNLIAPLEDPSYFCTAPDPSLPSSIVADTILQDCAAGKTIAVPRGRTVTVALESDVNVDVWTQWSDVTVSSGQVLVTVGAPIRIPESTVRYTGRSYEVAVYQAGRPGQAMLSAVQSWCDGNHGGACDRGRRWWVKVEVT